MRSVLLFTVVLAIAGYFAWNQWQGPNSGQAQLDDCHRLAGRGKALQEGGATTIPDEMIAKAQACAASFGARWARDDSEHAVAMRAEGASGVN